jgi:hypothetical protein
MSNQKFLGDMAEIDARISELQAELTRLQRRRNELQPVSRLLPEIHSEIFAFVQGFDAHPLFFDEDNDIKRWSPILRVCYL